MGRTVVVDLGRPHARAAREEALLGAALRRVGDDARDLRVARAARREDAPLLARAAALGEDCARRVERRERLARVRDEEHDRAVESRGRVAALRHRAANIPAHTHRFFGHAGCLLCIGRWMSGRVRKGVGELKNSPHAFAHLRADRAQRGDRAVRRRQRRKSRRRRRERARAVTAEQLENLVRRHRRRAQPRYCRAHVRNPLAAAVGGGGSIATQWAEGSKSTNDDLVGARFVRRPRAPTRA